jgi:crotonobetainyl-CoA:carnitine CoA-transferase CaiB-like acyl-CoA transferase
LEVHDDVPFLKGIRIIDLSRAMAGPYCTMMLADLGAEVIKVELMTGGDESRQWGPPFINGESTYFLSVNRNKKSIAIDLRSELGRSVLRKLTKESDVIIENFRPGTTAKLGIDYKTLKVLNPSLIYCSISGFGQTGPYRDKPGYDIIALAMSGMMSMMGEKGGPPIKAGVPISDIGAGMFAAFAIVCALFRRQSANIGEYIDVSLLEGQMAWLTYQALSYFATGRNPEKAGSAHPSIVPYQAFRASDSNFFIVGVGSDEQFQRFCDAISFQELKSDIRFGTNRERVRNRDVLIDKLTTHFLKDTSFNWVSKITEAGIPCSLVNKLENILTDPLVKSRDILQDCEHPMAGKIRLIGPPYHFENFSFKITGSPPLLGQHTRQVLSKVGYSAIEIDELISKGVIK